MKLRPSTPISQYPEILAEKWEHPIARYNSNPLITALRPLPDDEQLQTALSHLPEFEDSDRNAPAGLRIQLLEELTSFYLCLPRVVDAMQAIHAMIFQSYLRRAPLSTEDALIRQKLYQSASFSDLFGKVQHTITGEFVAALLGIPGGGKSQAVLRSTAHLRCVIYHEELDIYQIPVLIIEMPYQGSSVVTLAYAIIHALNSAFPSGNYVEIYLKRYPNAEALLIDALSLLRIHYVGMLIVDEGQNTNYIKYSQSKAIKSDAQTPLASLLITATNAIKVPLLFCATPELRDTLSGRLSMKRRTAGRGLSDWGPLSLGTIDGSGKRILGEFEVFLQTLWKYQLTKVFTEFTQEISNAFYLHTLGIPDLIVKLFHSVQRRAIRHTDSEIISLELIHEVARSEFADLSEFMDDIRNRNISRISAVSDIAAYMRIKPHAAFMDIGNEGMHQTILGQELSAFSAIPAGKTQQYRQEPTPALTPRRKRGTAVARPKKNTGNSTSSPIDPLNDFHGELDKP